MRCPHCQSASASERSDRTAHGYRRFRCWYCGRGFNERTGTALNRLQLPTDIAFLMVLWRLRLKLSVRDFAEILLLRGLVFSHEAVREWEAKLAPLLTDALRQHRRGRIGSSWYVDEMYLKVGGRWQYLYGAIDRDGNLVDVYLCETRDKATAEAFFRLAVAMTGVIPETVTTDKHSGYPPALEEVFGDEAEHRTSKYKNNHLKQDHRGIKGRAQSTRGFQTHISASRFCRAHDEVRNFLRPATRHNQNVSAARRRAIHIQRVAALRDMLAVA